MNVIQNSRVFPRNSKTYLQKFINVSPKNQKRISKKSKTYWRRGQKKIFLKFPLPFSMARTKQTALRSFNLTKMIGAKPVASDRHPMKSVNTIEGANHRVRLMQKLLIQKTHENEILKKKLLEMAHFFE